MMKVEKSVFISYRRTDWAYARAIYENLKHIGYDVFMDVNNIGSGDFGQTIIDNIKERAHFILILMPDALNRCVNHEDWLRREIETAIDSKRNIVPLLFEKFDWADAETYLRGNLSLLNKYNSLRVRFDSFDDDMKRLHERFLNIDLNTINHPSLSEAQYYFERGEKQYFDEIYDKAIPEYTESLKYDPHNHIAYYQRGYCYWFVNRKELAEQDFDRAIEEANRAINQNPEDEMAYHSRGAGYNGKKQFDLAIDDYDRALRINPEFAIAYYSRGISYKYREPKKDGDHNQAIADFTEAISRNSKLAQAYYNRGNAYFDIKDYDRAIADYERALKINPTHKLARKQHDEALQKQRGG